MAEQLALGLTQRWTETEESWRPGAEPIATWKYEVAAIPDDTTPRTFVERHHYSRSYVAARRRFGLYRGDDLQGVAVFSQYMSAASFGPLPLSDPKAGIELGRLVLIDQVPGNGESWFVARCFELLRRDGFEAVLSFSDPEPRTRADGSIVHPGHVGIVYQALSACYTGRATPRTLRLLADGTALSDRTLQKIRAGERGAAPAIERLEQLGAMPFDARDPAAWLRREVARLTRPLRHPGNHRYLWALTRRGRKALPASQAYPAPPGGRAAPKFGRRVARAARPPRSASIMRPYLTHGSGCPIFWVWEGRARWPGRTRRRWSRRSRSTAPAPEAPATSRARRTAGCSATASRRKRAR